MFLIPNPIITGASGLHNPESQQYKLQDAKQDLSMATKSRS